MTEHTLNITGMACGGCVAGVESVLAALAGVQSVAVTLTPPQARVVYDPETVQPAAFRQAVVDAGFGVAD